jgi:ribonuclease BN (tRNA processing enzyme)
MRLKVLGCSGGIGRGLRTTSFLVDDDILIDAGTGVGDLTLEEMQRIDHIFVTHSHLDHIASIPFLVDTVGWQRDRPVIIHATEATLAILKDHVFNWLVWPDFNLIPSGHAPFMVYETVAVGETVDLGGRRITPVPVNHVVPAVGYRLDSGRASLVYTGDTTASDDLWAALNRMDNLRYLLIETSFCNREHNLAVISGHFCPSLLGEGLKKLQRPPEIWITHLKPNEIDLTMAEIAAAAAGFRPRALQDGQVFEF